MQLSPSLCPSSTLALDPIQFRLLLPLPSSSSISSSLPSEQDSMFKTIQPPDNLYSVARISPTPFLGSSVGGKWLAALTTYVAAPVSLRHPLDTRPPGATAAAQKPVEVQFCLQLKCCHVPRDWGRGAAHKIGDFADCALSFETYVIDTEICRGSNVL